MAKAASKERYLNYHEKDDNLKKKTINRLYDSRVAARLSFVYVWLSCTGMI